MSLRIVHSSFKHPTARRRGFTLLETLLALALLALLASVLIGGASSLLNEQPTSADEVFWKAVQEARKTALKLEHEVRLKFDKEKKQFVLIDGLAPATLADDGFTLEEKPLKTFPIPSATTGDLTIDFLAAGKSGSTILIAGMLVESQPIGFVTFYSDGTCSAFRVQIVRNGATHTLSIDPWTCAQVLTPTEPNSSF